MDTTTSTGKLVFQIFGSFAEFERNVIRECIDAGRAVARGRKGGRPKLATDAAKRKKIEMARALHTYTTNGLFRKNSAQQFGQGGMKQTQRSNER